MIKLTKQHYTIARQRREWPLYSTQLLNIAAQNAKAFSYVGFVKDLWAQFRATGQPDTLEAWEAWYRNTQGMEGIDEATRRLCEMRDKMQLHHLSDELCRDYIEEVVFNKTHMGMGGESAAIQAAANYFKLPFSLSTTKQEESQGIDGYIGRVPVQVKPHCSVKKAHVTPSWSLSTHLYITYEPKSERCYIHNPELIQAPFS